MYRDKSQYWELIYRSRLHFGWACDLSVEGLRVCYLMVMVVQADADGATGAGQDGCHGVEVN